MDVRVRFAPSPTGYLHIGGGRTALYNWLFARQHDGTFILRIDDTDEVRSTEESTRQILESLKWLGLDWDEGPEVGGPHSPYFQSERQPVYHEYIDKLVESGHAYSCYCTPEELEAERQRAIAEKGARTYSGKCRDLTSAEREKMESEGRPAVLRMRTEPGSVVFEDMVLGRQQKGIEEIGDFIIARSDGTPVYLFTSPIDDYVMNITHVIRGADHVDNTSKQILIYRALGVEPPQFGHLPLVLGGKGEKLSKRRHGDLVEIGRYRRDGYLPAALINYLVRLGWSYDDKEEIFSVADLLEKFDMARVGSSSSVFDMKKLQWLNKHYIFELPLAERTDAVIPFLQRAGLLPKSPVSPERRAWLEKLVESIEDRMTVLEEIPAHCHFLLSPDDGYDYEAKADKKFLQKEGVPEALKAVRQLLVDTEPFDAEALEAAIQEFVGRTEIRIWQPLRVALTGESRGPGLYEILELLGRDSVLVRIDRTISRLTS